MATMKNGYHYSRGKKIGYDISVGNMIFHHVSYQSKGNLIYQLERDGYKKKDIEVERQVAVN